MWLVGQDWAKHDPISWYLLQRGFLRTKLVCVSYSGTFPRWDRQPFNVFLAKFQIATTNFLKKNPVQFFFFKFYLFIINLFNLKKKSAVDGRRV
jgi:hypothetical protein